MLSKSVCLSNQFKVKKQFFRSYTKDNKKNTKLLSPYKLGNIELKNRIVMAPLTRSRANNEEGVPTDLMVEYYKQRSSAGLIITEAIPVSPMAIGYINLPGIFTQKQVEGWKKVTNAVHERNGKIFAQIWHVGRISHPDFLNGKLPLAPSAINPHTQAYTKSGFKDTVTPKEMTKDEIKQTIQEFKQAALNAMESNMDGIELHGANGYLFHQFFSKISNKRTDEYGGSIENRSRFLFETIEAIGKEIDLGKLGVRLSPYLQKIGGIELDDETDTMYEYIVKKLNDYNIGYVHITNITGYEPHDNLERTIEVIKKFRPLFKGTLIANRKFDRDSANKVIEDGIADLVSFGELYVSNPDLVERFEKNAPLNPTKKEYFYTPTKEGYTDYPFLSDEMNNK